MGHEGARGGGDVGKEQPTGYIRSSPNVLPLVFGAEKMNYQMVKEWAVRINVANCS